MSKILGALALLAVLGAAGFGYWWWNTPCREGCNVILIMVDTLSADHLAAYGYERDTMPKTEAFFKNGVIFDDATANSPWTLPSFTGMYFSDIASRIAYAELDNGSRPTLQSALRERDVTLRAVERVPQSFISDGISRLFSESEKADTDINEHVFDAARRELESLEGNDAPFFLLVHTFAAHDPYAPDEPYEKLFGESDEYPTVDMNMLRAESAEEAPDRHTADVFRLRYDQQLSEVDAQISSFLETIPSATLKNTVVIFSADHGEAFNEHKFLWHGNSLFREELHIPLMMRVPGVSARRIAEPVSLMDMAPTVLSFFNIPAPDTFKGESLSPLMRGGSLGTRIIPLVQGFPYYLKMKPGTLKTYSSLDDAGAAGTERKIIDPYAAGVRMGDEKAFLFYPQNPADAVKIPELSLYNLAADSYETENLAEGKTLAGLPVPFKNALEALANEGMLRP